MTETETIMGIVFGKTGVAEPVYDCLLSRASSSTTNFIPYEIRRYGKKFACETEYKMGMEGTGFPALAGYIGVGKQPQNDGGAGGMAIDMTAPVVTQKVSSGGKAIAMTAPVVTSGGGGNSNFQNEMKKMQFILPKEFDSLEKIPQPTNSKVKIVEIPPSTGAVHAFSGSCNDQKAKSKVQELIKQLKEDGVEIDSESAIQNFSIFQYHPPFTISAFRRNEVWIDLTDSQVDSLLNRFRN